MNDPHTPLTPGSIRLTLIAAVAIVLLGGLDWLITTVCIAAVILYFAGWDMARMRAAARALARTVIGE